MSEQKCYAVIQACEHPDVNEYMLIKSNRFHRDWKTALEQFVSLSSVTEYEWTICQVIRHTTNHENSMIMTQIEWVVSESDLRKNSKEHITTLVTAGN